MELTLPLEIRSPVFGRGESALTVGGAPVGSIRAGDGELVVEYMGQTLRYGRAGSGRETTLVLPDGESIAMKERSVLFPSAEFEAHGEGYRIRGGPFSVRVVRAPGDGMEGGTGLSPAAQTLLRVGIHGLFRLRYRFDPRLPVPFEFGLLAWLAAQRYRQQLLTVVLPILLMGVGRLIRELF
jgi:hypothetical protein